MIICKIEVPMLIINNIQYRSFEIAQEIRDERECQGLPIGFMFAVPM